MGKNLALSLLEIILVVAFAIPTIIALFFGAPFIPTPKERVLKMLKLAKIKKGDKLYDLGCGDGRFVYLAAKKYGAEAIGIEFSPLVYLWARIKKFFWKSKAKIVFGNFWRRDFSDADILVFFLLPKTVSVLAKKLEKELKPGTLVLSYAFRIKEWEPIYLEPKNKKNCAIWVYKIGKHLKK